MPTTGDVPEGERNALFWQPAQGRPWLKIVGASAAVLLVAAGAMVFAFSGDDDTPRPDASTGGAVPPSSSAQAPPTASVAAQPRPVAPASTPSTPASAPPAEPAPAPVAVENIDQCVARHYAPDAFGEELPKFAFVCDATDPRRAAMGLKARLVYAQRKGGPVTDAMKEWSILNWYELAFVSIVQQTCCVTPPVLDSKNKTCDFDERIVAIGVAGRTGKGIDEAIVAYDKAVQCLINFGLSAHYKQKHPTYGPERDAFKRISERSRQK